jgi:hypothetical protein
VTAASVSKSSAVWALASQRTGSVGARLVRLLPTWRHEFRVFGFPRELRIRYYVALQHRSSSHYAQAGAPRSVRAAAPTLAAACLFPNLVSCWGALKCDDAFCLT